MFVNASSRAARRMVVGEFEKGNNIFQGSEPEDEKNYLPEWERLLLSDEDSNKFIDKLVDMGEKVPLALNSTSACVAFVDISGFSVLSEKLNINYGAEGPELLANIISKYFSEFIHTISHFGGDVIRFAGDAILVCWSQKEYPHLELESLAILALECCNELTRRHAICNIDVDVDATLSLHCALGCGQIQQMIAGGYDSFEFVMAGDPIHQIANGLSLANTGQTIVSPQVVELLKLGIGDGELVLNGFFLLNPAQVERRRSKVVTLLHQIAPIDSDDDDDNDDNDGNDDNDDSDDNDDDSDGDYQLPASYATSAIIGKTRSTNDLSSVKEFMEKFVPVFVADRVKAVQRLALLCELRTVSIMFITMKGAKDSDPAALQLLNKTLYAVQVILNLTSGIVRQFIIDDKGATIICAHGSTGQSHQDDATRALLSSILISMLLPRLGIAGKLGVTTGQVFCGPLGDSHRWEFSIVGSAVNLAARLSHVNLPFSIICDANTMEITKKSFSFTEIPTPLTLKGYSSPIICYHPFIFSTMSLSITPSLKSQKTKPTLLSSYTKFIQTLVSKLAIVADDTKNDEDEDEDDNNDDKCRMKSSSLSSTEDDSIPFVIAYGSGGCGKSYLCKSLKEIVASRKEGLSTACNHIMGPFLITGRFQRTNAFAAVETLLLALVIKARRLSRQVKSDDAEINSFIDELTRRGFDNDGEKFFASLPNQTKRALYFQILSLLMTSVTDGKPMAKMLLLIDNCASVDIESWDILTKLIPKFRGSLIIVATATSLHNAVENPHDLLPKISRNLTGSKSSGDAQLDFNQAVTFELTKIPWLTQSELLSLITNQLQADQLDPTLSNYLLARFSNVNPGVVILALTFLQEKGYIITADVSVDDNGNNISPTIAAKTMSRTISFMNNSSFHNTRLRVARLSSFVTDIQLASVGLLYNMKALTLARVDACLTFTQQQLLKTLTCFENYNFTTSIILSVYSELGDGSFAASLSGQTSAHEVHAEKTSLREELQALVINGFISPQEEDKESFAFVSLDLVEIINSLLLFAHRKKVCLAIAVALEKALLASIQSTDVNHPVPVDNEIDDDDDHHRVSRRKSSLVPLWKAYATFSTSLEENEETLSSISQIAFFYTKANSIKYSIGAASYAADLAFKLGDFIAAHGEYRQLLLTVDVVGTDYKSEHVAVGDVVIPKTMLQYWWMQCGLCMLHSNENQLGLRIHITGLKILFGVTLAGFDSFFSPLLHQYYAPNNYGLTNNDIQLSDAPAATQTRRRRASMDLTAPPLGFSPASSSSSSSPLTSVGTTGTTTKSNHPSPNTATPSVLLSPTFSPSLSASPGSSSVLSRRKSFDASRLRINKDTKDADVNASISTKVSITELATPHSPRASANRRMSVDLSMAAMVAATATSSSSLPVPPSPKITGFAMDMSFPPAILAVLPASSPALTSSSSSSSSSSSLLTASTLLSLPSSSPSFFPGSCSTMVTYGAAVPAPPPRNPLVLEEWMVPIRVSWALTRVHLSLLQSGRGRADLHPEHHAFLQSVEALVTLLENKKSCPPLITPLLAIQIPPDRQKKKDLYL